MQCCSQQTLRTELYTRVPSMKERFQMSNGITITIAQVPKAPDRRTGGYPARGYKMSIHTMA